ncbi:hypothetical protein AB0B28_11485 [Glycomyces sp. NPDC046736]|uniref:hypothetical protein n=1 Tax=Glycomyces sp. NPDC046736 TaxID=3155615 RepID=UPI0033DF0F45
MTIEDSIAIRIEALQAERHMTFKDTINHLLGLGLDAWENPSPQTEEKRTWTKPRSFGKQLLPYEANTAEMLALLEGEEHK